MDKNKRALITGGTGQQKRAAARAFAERGWQVRILTRDAGSNAAQALARDGAEIAIGNGDDSASLEAAMKGAEAVFCVVPLVTSFVQECLRQTICRHPQCGRCSDPGWHWSKS